MFVVSTKIFVDILEKQKARSVSTGLAEAKFRRTPYRIAGRTGGRICSGMCLIGATLHPFKGARTGTA